MSTSMVSLKSGARLDWIYLHIPSKKGCHDRDQSWTTMSGGRTRLYELGFGVQKGQGSRVEKALKHYLVKIGAKDDADLF
jgi:hypothetical protein